MTMCRRFHGEPVQRLIVSVPLSIVLLVDKLLLSAGSPSRSCRAEFVRRAIAETLKRDLMISQHLKETTEKATR